MYRTIDLFAGAGGLSLGFLQTGKFDIKVAFENPWHGGPPITTSIFPYFFSISL